jgi:hypothetical protein
MLQKASMTRRLPMLYSIFFPAVGVSGYFLYRRLRAAFLVGGWRSFISRYMGMGGETPNANNLKSINEQRHGSMYRDKTLCGSSGPLHKERTLCPRSSNVKGN